MDHKFSFKVCREEVSYSNIGNLRYFEEADRLQHRDYFVVFL